MTLYGYIIALLLSLPSPPEPDVLWVAADAIHQGTTRAVEDGRWKASPARLARLLVLIGHFEARYLERIQEGRCDVKRGECDYGRAASWWQLQATSLVPIEEWRTLTGEGHEPARRAAWAAARVLSHGDRACRGSQGAVSFYATGRCDWPGAAGRMKLYRLLQNAVGSPRAAETESVDPGPS